MDETDFYELFQTLREYYVMSRENSERILRRIFDIFEGSGNG